MDVTCPGKRRNSGDWRHWLGMALVAGPLSGCGAPEPEVVIGEGATRDVTPDARSDAPVQAYINATVFRGDHGDLIEDAVVLVRSGRILEVGGGDAIEIPEGAETVDLSGRFLMPGLINAHGHVNPSGDRSSIAEQLEIYAHYGVTTVLSLGDDGIHMEGDRWSPDPRTARLFVSGPSLNPGSPEAAESEVARVEELGVDWVKVHVMEGRGEHVGAVIAAAKPRGLPVAVHIETLADAVAVLRDGAALLGHSVRDEAVDDVLIDLMRSTGACLTPTLTRELSTFVYAERPGFFDDPFFLERSAPHDLDSYLTPERSARARSPQAQYWRDALPLAKQNMTVLHQAGARIAMGTDSGPSGRFQGYFEHLELEMMVDAGMTPVDVLISATARAADCIGLGDRIGRIAPGLWADMIALDENPLEDIRNTRTLHGVWVAGNRVR